jgi:hypothetical protein
MFLIFQWQLLLNIISVHFVLNIISVHFLLNIISVHLMLNFISVRLLLTIIYIHLLLNIISVHFVLNFICTYSLLNLMVYILCASDTLNQVHYHRIAPGFEIQKHMFRLHSVATFRKQQYSQTCSALLCGLSVVRYIKSNNANVFITPSMILYYVKIIIIQQNVKCYIQRSWGSGNSLACNGVKDPMCYHPGCTP